MRPAERRTVFGYAQCTILVATGNVLVEGAQSTERTLNDLDFSVGGLTRADAASRIESRIIAPQSIIAAARLQADLATESPQCRNAMLTTTDCG